MRHDLDVRMNPFQAPQRSLDGLILGRFGRTALVENDVLWCVPLSMELMIAAGMFHLSYSCMAMD